MPRYELKILEPPDGRRVTTSEHESPEGEWFVEGYTFEHEGRTLEVRLIQTSDAGYDQQLVCAVRD